MEKKCKIPHEDLIGVVKVSYFTHKLGVVLPAAMLYKVVCQLEDVKINNGISNDANEHLI